jgi:Tn3 transposase DDE domain
MRPSLELYGVVSRNRRIAIIYYNSAILSHLLTKYEASGNAKAVTLITQMSPAAWQHILLNGHYTFQSGGKIIDLAALLDGQELG